MSGITKSNTVRLNVQPGLRPPNATSVAVIKSMTIVRNGDNVIVEVDFEQLAAAFAAHAANVASAATHSVEIDTGKIDGKTLHRRLTHILSVVPLDEVLSKIAKIHEAHGHKFGPTFMVVPPTTYQHTRADAQLIRECIPRLSPWAITAHVDPPAKSEPKRECLPVEAQKPAAKVKAPRKAKAST